MIIDKKNNNKNNYLLDEDFLIYEKNNFEHKAAHYCLEVKFNEITLFLKYTIYRKNSENVVSLYSLPAQLFSNEDITKENLKIITTEIKKKFSSNDLKLNFKIAFRNSQNQNKLNELLKINPFLITENQFIDLSKSEEEIFDSMKSNHKNEIKKSLSNSNITNSIIDKKNYKNDQIFEMMQMHETVVSKKTRDKKTWKIMEDMILKNKGFLTQTKYNDQIISYSFFFHNKYESHYFSSVAFRDIFNITGINHLSLWHAIIYAKKTLKLEKFKLGITKYLYIRNSSEIDQKQINIAFFKSRFCGTKYFQTTIDENSYI